VLVKAGWPQSSRCARVWPPRCGRRRRCQPGLLNGSASLMARPPQWLGLLNGSASLNPSLPASRSARLAAARVPSARRALRGPKPCSRARDPGSARRARVGRGTCDAAAMRWAVSCSVRSSPAGASASASSGRAASTSRLASPRPRRRLPAGCRPASRIASAALSRMPATASGEGVSGELKPFAHANRSCETSFSISCSILVVTAYAKWCAGIAGLLRATRCKTVDGGWRPPAHTAT
jgi:hypothetical protein